MRRRVLEHAEMPVASRLAAGFLVEKALDPAPDGTVSLV